MRGEKWTHAICEGCWENEFPHRGSPPVALANAEVEHCCFCGIETANGVYVRHAPAGMQCQLPKMVNALDPRLRDRVCRHVGGFTYQGTIPCTGPKACSMCGTREEDATRMEWKND